VPRSPRFEDLEEKGRPVLFDTRAAMLWDDSYLYVGFWLEERDAWRIGLLRHQPINQRMSRFLTTWTPYPMGEGVHVPEGYSAVGFSSAGAG
jgi:hypothetical protein